MTEPLQTIMTTEVAREMYDLISRPDDTRNPEFLEDKEIIKRLKTVKLSLSNYDNVVHQNKNLQKELNTLKKQPFFPYMLNSGNNQDFGEFYLISHAWFSITNFPIQLGIVEVEWKSSGVRKMYLGAGSTGGKDFNKDVLSIALHGQKIKDSSEGI
jgi:hypothetical protein